MSNKTIDVCMTIIMVAYTAVTVTFTIILVLWALGLFEFRGG